MAVLKVRPEHRSHCALNDISLPAVQLAFQKLGVVRVEKKYPRAPAISDIQLKRNPRLVDLTLTYNIYFDEQADVLRICQQLTKLGVLAYAEPEYISYPLAYVPNDPLVGSSGQAWLNVVQATQAWDLARGDTNIVIGVVDASCNWDHEDLNGSLKRNSLDPINGTDDDNDGYIDNYAGWDFVGTDARAVPGAFITILPDNNTRVNPTPPAGSTLSPVVNHGTATTSIAAAKTDNGIGMAGAGFNCKFLPTKHMHDYNGGGLYFTTDGIFYAATHGAHVINMSYGSRAYSQNTQDVVNFATFNEDCALVAAAGNSITEQVTYPASYENVLSVTSTDNSDVLTNAYGPRVDVSAPGGTTTAGFNNGYGGGGGQFTSFSAPVAAGLVGLVRARFPTYTALQALERVRVTSDDVYALNTNPAYANKMGKGRVNFLKALTLSSPSIRLIQHAFRDGNDNYIQPGEAFEIRATFKNFLDPASNATIQITTTDPYVSAQSTSYTAGAFAALAEKVSPNGTFAFTAAANTPRNHSVTFRITYQDGFYTDFELVTLRINEVFQTVASRNVSTSVGVDGKWGQNPYSPNQWLGRGWQYEDFSDYLWEGGFLLGTGPTELANNLRITGGKTDSHFVAAGNPLPVLNPLRSDVEIRTQWNDSRLPTNPKEFQVSHYAYGFDEEVFGRMVLYRYVIKNPKVFSISNVYAALAADWDFNSNALQDTAGYDAGRRLLYSWGVDNIGQREGCNAYMGMVLLTDDYPVQARTVDVSTFSFNMADKFAAISSGTSQASRQGVDVYQFLGVGPTTVFANDSIELAYALISACSLAELQDLADTALFRYGCLFKQNALTVVVPQNPTGCETVTVQMNTPGATRHTWSPGTLPEGNTQVFHTSGIYRVQAHDAAGCVVEKEIQVTVLPTPQPSITLNDTLLSMADGAVLNFSEGADPSLSRTWSFGNGFGFSGRSGSYAFSRPGSYTVAVTVGNGTCTAMRDTTVRVVLSKTTSRTNATGARSLQLYPNPTQQRSFFIQPPLPGAEATMLLVDALGRVAYQQVLAPATHHEIQLPGQVAAGVYQVVVRQSGIQEQARLVVQ
jgi:hypothetical protein